MKAGGAKAKDKKVVAALVEHPNGAFVGVCKHSLPLTATMSPMNLMPHGLVKESELDV